MKMSNNCQNCGSTVSNDYARTFGDNNNVVHHCMHCIPEEDGGNVEMLRRGVTAYENLEKAKRAKRKIE